MKAFVAGLVCLVAQAAFAPLAFSQGVVCQLPPDGTWVRFEGTYAQTENRPESAGGKLDIVPWIEKVWIKSVGTEMADYKGKMTACRWIEIKIDRGREKDGNIDTGLTGSAVYKVLIPESVVISDNVDDDGVPVSFLPLVKGFRKVGKADPKPLTEPALQLYPLGILVGYYRELNVIEDSIDPEVGIEAVKQAVQLQGKVSIERASSRTVQESTVWKSADMPFGIARWSAKITRQVKDAQDPREKFDDPDNAVSEVTIEMKAKETGTEGPEGKSELTVP